MQINNFCCIGAELQNKMTQSTKMAQIYFYRTFEEETMAEMLKDGFFNVVYDRVKVNDLILLYSPNEEQLLWTKVISNMGGQVKTQYVEDVFVWDKLREHDKKFEYVEEELEQKEEEIKTTLKWLGNRSNIFEILPDIEQLNPLQYRKTTYTNVQKDSFVRIPVKTWLEENENIKNITGEFAQYLNVGALVVDENGTMGVVEEFEDGDEEHYKNVVVTTISPQATLSKAIVGAFWFGKTKAETVAPNPTIVGQNYYDFTTGESYTSTNGTSWTKNDKKVEIPEDIDCQIMITSKFWDIAEQTNQHGGIAYHSEINKDWSYVPYIYEQDFDVLKQQIQTVDNNALHKTGNETITGEKTFTSKIYEKTTEFGGVFIDYQKPWEENPDVSGSGGGSFEIRDKNGSWGVIFGSEKYTDGRRCVKIQTRSPDKNTNDGIRLFANNGGVVYTDCPRCRTANLASTTARDIITAADLNSRLNTVFGINYASPTATVVSGGSWAENSTYTAPSDGYIIISSLGRTCKITADGKIVGQTSTDSGGGWTSSIGNVFLIVKKGCVIKATGGNLDSCYFYFWSL